MSDEPKNLDQVLSQAKSLATEAVIDLADGRQLWASFDSKPTWNYVRAQTIFFGDDAARERNAGEFMEIDADTIEGNWPPKSFEEGLAIVARELPSRGTLRANSIKASGSKSPVKGRQLKEMATSQWQAAFR